MANDNNDWAQWEKEAKAGVRPVLPPQADSPDYANWSHPDLDKPISAEQDGDG